MSGAQGSHVADINVQSGSSGLPMEAYNVRVTTLSFSKLFMIPILLLLS